MLVTLGWMLLAGLLVPSHQSKQVSPPGGPGLPGRCEVSFHAPTLFNGLLGLGQDGWSREWFVSRSETWKAKWR